MDILQGIAIFIIVFIPLIVIHELGHLLACKSVGISVVEFGLGFPPRVATLFRWGETDFTLNAVPLGGFVMPYGEDFAAPQGDEDMLSVRDELAARGVENPKSVFEATPLQKFWFLIAGPLANFIAAFAVFIIIPMLGVPTPISDVTIQEVFPESEAGIKALRQGDIITAVNGQSFDTAQDLEDLLAGFVEADPESAIVFSIDRPLTGQVFDTELTPNLEEVDENSPQERVRVLEVAVDTPADRAGLQQDDLILEANGDPILTLEQMQDVTAENEGQELLLTVEREGELVDIAVVPERLNGEERARVGITINILPVAPAFGFVVDDENIGTRDEVYPFVDAVELGTNEFIDTMELIITFPAELINGNLSAQEARPVSPVGVSQIGIEVVENNPYQDFILLIAVISIALGISNLLPIPGLDGGRILFVFIEVIRGKPMEPEREGLVHMMGIIFVLLLSVVIIINDIVNPVV